MHPAAMRLTNDSTEFYFPDWSNERSHILTPLKVRLNLLSATSSEKRLLIHYCVFPLKPIVLHRESDRDFASGDSLADFFSAFWLGRF